MTAALCCEVDFEPIGRRVQVEHGESLLDAAQRTGVNILLGRAGIGEADIDTVIIAGAFGTYLRESSPPSG